MKGSICTVIGAIGGGIAALFGGWDSALVTLIIFMGIDFATGMIPAQWASPNTARPES